MKFFFACLLIYIISGCGTRYGSLTVNTYPITGSVFVDGKSYGDAPVTIGKLTVGEHEVFFSEYSDQYSTPINLTVLINYGKSTEITGIYKNSFISEIPPDGFSPADSIRIFGTSERRLKDGTIFDYINGGGVVYLNHGLHETTHIVFKDSTGNQLTVDIFDMGNRRNAREAFNDEEICPSGFSAGAPGTESKEYHYEPDFLLFFHKSKYLVYLGINNDNLRKILEDYASEIYSRIPD